MTRAELTATAVTCALALAVVLGYLADAAGFGIRPLAVALPALAGGAALAWIAGRQSQPFGADDLTFAGVAVVVVEQFASAVAGIAHHVAVLVRGRVGRTLRPDRLESADLASLYLGSSA